MSRYSIELSGDIEKKLNDYMKDNKIKLRSKAIKSCINKATQKEDFKTFVYELDQKMNRILFRLNLNKKLLEQLFVNFGFAINENIENDFLLKDFYDKNNSYKGRYD